MGYPVRIKFEGKEIKGNFEFGELLKKIEKMVKEHGEEEKEGKDC